MFDSGTTKWVCPLCIASVLARTTASSKSDALMFSHCRKRRQYILYLGSWLVEFIPAFDLRRS